MNKKLFFTLPLMLFLTACNTMQYSNQNAYTPDPFWDNQRIVFRDVTIPPGAYNYYHRTKVKKYPTGKYKQTSYHKNKQTLAFNKISYTFTKDDYGSSLNDRLNGVTKPYTPSIAEPVSVPQSNNVVPVNVVQPSPVINQKPVNSNQINTQQVNTPPGTTYVPLTFPVPPPKAMMQQFHMKIGQANSSDSNN